ncbi:PKD domain-containing protein [Kitasatospora sp. NPDC059827]|uniref:PKD domain-containing protein n=1 Tax=Kitasatospora sp. NPDC059827 TaxID=3346964 RepID=UPI00365DA632
MRQRHLAGLAIATVTALGAGLPAPASAVADSTTLFVNSATGCTDTGSGSQAAPFCTVQAAVDAARPGQTVQVAAAKYREQVTLSHSGEPGHPITVRGGNIRNGQKTLSFVGVNPGGTTPDYGFVLNGVHDVTITGFGIGGALGSVQLNGTQQVTLDGNIMGGGSSSGPQTVGVHLSGTAQGTTISRNIIKGRPHFAVVVDAGATGTVLTTNAVDNQAGGAGIQVTDAPGTVITSNTVSSVCGPAIGLLGDSSRAVVENNVLATAADTGHNAPACAPDQSTAKLSVSTGSVPGTVADYNLAEPFADGPIYSWAGSSYATAADFTKAVPQQGAHDLTTEAHYSGNADTELPIGSNSAAVDSADADAPGELSTDLYGYQRIDHPYVANTGTGSKIYDRGAFEYTTSSRFILVEGRPWKIPAGASTTVAIRDQETWSPVVSYTIDFGDGTPTVTTTELAVQHTYQTAGSYQPTVVATEQNGDTTTSNGTVEDVVPPAPLVPKLTFSPDGVPLGYRISGSSSTSAWSLTGFTVDFGDGSAPVAADVFGDTTHSYANEGDYTVTLTVTDAGGRSEQTTQLLHVAYPAGS